MANTRIGAGVLDGKKLQFWMTQEMYDQLQTVRFETKSQSESAVARTALEVFFAVHKGDTVYKDTDGKVVFLAEEEREAGLS